MSLPAVAAGPGLDLPAPRRLAIWLTVRGPLAVFTAYALLAVLLTLPTATGLTYGVGDLGDPVVMAWYLAWYAHVIPGNLGGLLNAPFFFPFPSTLLYHDHLLAQGLAAWPIVRLTGNPVLALNLEILASYALGAFGVYLLVRRFTGSRAVAFITGIMFAFSPFRLAHVSQVNLLWLHWLPFALLFLDRFLTARRWRDLLLTALFINVLVLSSYNFAPLVTTVIGCWVIGRLAFAPRSIRPALIGGLTLIAVLTAAINVPLLYRYLQVSDQMGFTRTLDEVRLYSAAPADYLVTPPNNLVFGSLSAPLRSSVWSERALFPGALTLVFGMFGLAVGVLARSTRPIAVTLGAIALVSLILSFGLGTVTASLPVLGWYGWLYEHVPGVEGLRAPARAGGIVQFALVGLAGFGVAGLLRAIGPRPAASVAAGVIAVLVILESVSLPAGYAVPVAVGENAIPLNTDYLPALGKNNYNIPDASFAVYDWLRTAPGGGAVLELPMVMHTGKAWAESLRMMAQTHHWRPLVNGTSAYRPANLIELSQRLTAFPRPPTVQLIAGLGVEYVVLHRASYAPDELATIDAALPSSPLIEVARFGDDVVYRFGELALAVPEQQRLSLEIAPDSAAGSPKPVALAFANTGEAPFVPAQSGVYTIVVRWQKQGGGSGQVVEYARPPLMVPARETQRVAVPISLPDGPGDYTLSVTATGQLAPGGLSAEQTVHAAATVVTR